MDQSFITLYVSLFGRCKCKWYTHTPIFLVKWPGEQKCKAWLCTCVSPACFKSSTVNHLDICWQLIFTDIFQQRKREHHQLWIRSPSSKTGLSQDTIPFYASKILRFEGLYTKFIVLEGKSVWRPDTERMLGESFTSWWCPRLVNAGLACRMTRGNKNSMSRSTKSVPQQRCHLNQQDKLSMPNVTAPSASTSITINSETFTRSYLADSNILKHLIYCCIESFCVRAPGVVMLCSTDEFLWCVVTVGHDVFFRITRLDWALSFHR